MPKHSLGEILVAEDDQASGSPLSLLLELQGFEAICAADGQEAYLKATAEPPNLLLTILNIPKISKLDLIRHIKQETTLAALPVVAMNAAERQHLSHATKVGAAAVFQKPPKFDRVLALIAALAVSRRRRPESIRTPQGHRMTSVR